MPVTLRSMLALLLILALAGCQKTTPASSTDTTKKITVITTLFPLYEFARGICGDRGEVSLLLPPGVESHSFEPQPADLARISKADLFVFTNAAMEPWALKLVKGVASPSLTVVDASKGTQMLTAGKKAQTHHGARDEKGHRDADGFDPHLWLDFTNAAIIVDNLTAALSAKDPGGADTYRTRAAAFKAELQKLDADFSAGLADCRTRTFIHGGHYTFGYLANRYGLTYRSAQAVNPDAEPTPATIAELLQLVKTNSLEYVYAEELVSPRIAEMLSREAGVKILMLHGAHNISKEDLASGVTFIGLMRKNLENLRRGLACP